jgi:hypothetical protein
LGCPEAAAAAVICFEWLQRPENVLAGCITWQDYRPDAFPQGYAKRTLERTLPATMKRHAHRIATSAAEQLVADSAARKTSRRTSGEQSVGIETRTAAGMNLRKRDKSL